MKKSFLITWEGKYTPPTEEDIFNILLKEGFDDLAKINVKEVEE